MPTYCNRPFDTLLIDNNADCYICECEAWLPTKIGNCDSDSIDEILKSPLIQKIQQTIIDQSYSLCDLKNCMIYHTLEPATRIPITKIKKVVINIDRSCNLACPSCRKKQFIIKDELLLKNKIKVANQIIKFINGQSNLELRIGGDGDIFASQVYRHLLQKIEDNQHRIVLQTNGLLLHKSSKIIEKIFPMLDRICISFDANSQQTYQKVRFPGDWNILQKNVQWLIHNFPNIKRQADFVVQQKNYLELIDFIKDKSQTFDIINLQKITDWGTFDNFKTEAVWLDDHPEYNQFVDVITQAKKFPKVLINNLEPYVDKTV